MVETQIIARGIKQPAVIEAMLKVPRHLFVEEALRVQAYSDFPLPIGEKQTISQPYMVALMTEALELTGKERVLEIGSGSGYQSAVLSLLCEKIYAIERIAVLAQNARKTLDSLHCSNVITRVGDGTLGWPEEAPFDAILSAASSPEVPKALIDQLKPEGRLVMPIGPDMFQTLVRVTKSKEGYIDTVKLCECRFVKLIGRYGWQVE